MIGLIFEQITVLPKYSYLKFIDDCKEEVNDINDISYVAACISIEAEGIWSHDLHIIEQKKVKTFTNIEMLNLSKNLKSDRD